MKKGGGRRKVAGGGRLGGRGALASFLTSALTSTLALANTGASRGSTQQMHACMQEELRRHRWKQGGVDGRRLRR